MPVLTYFKDREDPRDYVYNPKKIFGKQILRRRKVMGVNGVVDYKKFMSPVKNQGNLGSCVGFAVTALKEYHENVEYLNERSAGSKYKREKSVYDLSEQWTYWKTKQIDPWGPDVEGTSIRYALKVLQKIGCPPEEGWEYTDDKFDIGNPESWTHLVARWNKIDSYWRLPDVDAIISAIRNGGPVLVGVGCYEEIFNPESDGFVSYPKYPQYCYGGHALLLTGYDLNKERVFFKNSWGTNWGQEGYGQFGFDYIRDFCWDAWAVKDAQVTKSMLKGTVTL